MYRAVSLGLLSCGGRSSSMASKLLSGSKSLRVAALDLRCGAGTVVVASMVVVDRLSPSWAGGWKVVQLISFAE